MSDRIHVSAVVPVHNEVILLFLHQSEMARRECEERWYMNYRIRGRWKPYLRAGRRR